MNTEEKTSNNGKTTSRKKKSGWCGGIFNCCGGENDVDKSNEFLYDDNEKKESTKNN